MPDYLRSPTCWGLAFGCVILTALLAFIIIRLAPKIGAVDRGGYRKVYHGAMPLMGGLAIALPFMGVCLAGIFGVSGMFGAIQEMRFALAILLLGSAAIVALGIADDVKGMRARWKFFVQFAVAALIALAGYSVQSVHLPLIGIITLGPILGTLLTILWIVGLTNAFNLIDGIDGLATGVAFISSTALAVIAAANGATFVVLLCIAMSASTLTFLAFNFHPAKIFLGDTGSLFLGFALATIALMGSYKSQTAFVLMVPALALGFPIFETLASVARRAVRGRPLFVGDHGHTHHRLLNLGYSQRQIALLIYSVALVGTFAAVLIRFASELSSVYWIPIGLCVGAVMVISWMAGYLRPAEAMRVSGRRQRNVVLSAFARYAALRLSVNSSPVEPEEILRIGCKELRLRFLEVRLDGLSAPLVSCALNRESGRSGQPADSLEEMRVRTANGRDVVLRYQYEHDPDDLERQDVAACLAHLFQQTRLETAPAATPANGA